MVIEPILRFMYKFDLGQVPAHKPELGQCWEWKFGKNHQGYAKFREGATGSRTIHGHCFAYEYFIGPIPEGLQLDHLCRNKSCVNPWHCEPVTGSENVFRGSNRYRDKTHCKHGHEFTPENTWLRTSGKYGRRERSCRTCHRIRARNKYRKAVGKKPDNALFIGTVKLTNPQVEEIRRLCKEGELSQREIGAKFSVAQSHVSSINTGRFRN